MARVTVEDCVDKVPNRFELVMLAAHRSRELSSGSELTVDRDKDKNPVVSLREIAEEDAMALLMGVEQDTPSDEMSEENLLRALMEAQEPS